MQPHCVLETLCRLANPVARFQKNFQCRCIDSRISFVAKRLFGGKGDLFSSFFLMHTSGIVDHRTCFVQDVDLHQISYIMSLELQCTGILTSLYASVAHLSSPALFTTNLQASLNSGSVAKISIGAWTMSIRGTTCLWFNHARATIRPSS